MKKYLSIALIAVLFLATGICGLAIFAPVDSRFEQIQAIVLPEKLDAYLQASEAVIQPKPGTEKSLVWAHDDHRKTPLSLVYLHGFSATRKEISPVTENLAKTLQANVFFTRLSGHGLGAEGLTQVHSYQWIEDAEEAFEIGKRLGDRVIVLGYSTGGALAVHLAHKKDPRLAGVVLLAPNFRPSTPFSLLSAGPLGSVITRLVVGEAYAWKPKNPEQAYYWTPQYPARAIHELMELLKYVNSLNVKSITTPALFVYSPRDTVVSIPEVLKKYQQWGSPLKKIVEFKTGAHVFAGNILAPEGNAPLEQEISEFIHALGLSRK